MPLQTLGRVLEAEALWVLFLLPGQSAGLQAA